MFFSKKTIVSYCLVLFTSIACYSTDIQAKTTTDTLSEVVYRQSESGLNGVHIKQANIQYNNILSWIVLGFTVVLIVFIIVLIKNNKYRKTAQSELGAQQQSLKNIIKERTARLNLEISERKIAEEADRIKSSFLANMSHELRTPMNAIMAFSGFLKNTEINQKEREEYIEHINTSCTNLAQLIDDIIDSAKIEARQLKINKISCDLNRLIKQIHNNHLNKQKPENKAKTTFKLNIPYTNDAVFIKTDPVRLKQILNNLIENAFQFTDKGHIEVGYIIINAGLIKFHIKDTGRGIPADKQNFVFERFSQFTTNNTPGCIGAGLGLPICKSLVELLGGNIILNSVPGKGSEFIFNIMVDHIEIVRGYESTLAQEIQITHKLSPADLHLDNKTILIAEDEDLNYKVLYSALKRTNATILRAVNGIEAIEMCLRNNIDLVLMDIQMPKLDGLSATSEIKKINPDIQVVAQTSFAMRGEKEKCLNAGCDNYLSKPINMQQLLFTVKKHLELIPV